MKPAEEIGIDELNESGIVHVGLEFCPTIGFDEMGEPFLSGTSAFHFIDRYNNKKIALQNKFGSYLENEDIQSCLHSLELDPVMFWYLLLFVYDYCVDTCNRQSDDRSDWLSMQRSLSKSERCFYLWRSYHVGRIRRI